jgi:hypothetical protein
VRNLDWLAIGTVLVLGFAWYLTYSAARLDRLHARIEGTLAALDAQLVRRAEATLELANSGALDAASAIMLADAASESLAAAELEEADAQAQAFTSEREAVESDLSDALDLALNRDAVVALQEQDIPVEDRLALVRAAAQRVQLARRFHNDAVTAVRRVRRKRVVALFRLAGHAAMPKTVEFDDKSPSGLTL